MAGVISAYLLSKEGRVVVLLEKGEVGGGVTSLTTAFLTQSIDTDFADIIKVFGLNEGKRILSSHQAAIDLIETIGRENSIECDFSRCSNYVYSSTPEDWGALEAERDAARSLGLQVELHRDGSALGFRNCGYLEIKGQARFHPLKFLSGLVERCVQMGVLVFEGTDVSDIDVSDAKTAVVAAGQYVVSARRAVSATYYPLSEPLSLFFKKGTYVTYVLEARVGARLPEGIFEDTRNPYHYMRIERDVDGEGSVVLVGGADHREEIPIDGSRNWNELEEHLKTLLPDHSYEITKRWSGPILEPSDGLALIGTIDVDEPVLYATAFSGNGMTYSAITGMIVADWVSHRKSPWATTYSADRLPGLKSLVTKGRDYVEELVGGAVKNSLQQPKNSTTKPSEDAR